jgi:hypothetical protein
MNKCFYQPLCVLGIGGIVTWLAVLCFFISIKIQRNWLAKKMNLQWIENYEKKTKRPISKFIAGLEKATQGLKKMLKFLEGFIIYFSLGFLISLLLNDSHDRITFKVLALTGICIPARVIITILITTLNDKRKRIVEIMEETRSGQQSSLSEAT